MQMSSLLNCTRIGGRGWRASVTPCCSLEGVSNDFLGVGSEYRARVY